MIALVLPLDCVWFLLKISKMDPKQHNNLESRMGLGACGQRGKGKTVKQKGGSGGHVTRAQTQAQAVATLFRDHIPLVVQNEIEAIKKHLWEVVQTIPIEYIQM